MIKKKNTDTSISSILAEVCGAIKDKSFIMPKSLKKHEINESKYPRNIIDAFRKMEPNKKKTIIDIFDIDKLNININDLSTPISKLLYLMVWKQGDMNKLDRIVAGLKSDPILDNAYRNINNAFVFFQFGRHIIFDEPIVDQHCIRAFAALVQEKKIIIESLKNEKIQYQTINAITGSELHKKLIIEYIKWVKDKSFESSEMHQIDNIMYGLGKYLKTGINKKKINRP